MLIIEGPDCAGKTTLAKALCEKLKLPYIHFSVLDKKWDYFEDYLSYMPVKGVCDRFFHSEVAYGLGVRDHSNISPAAWDYLVRKTRESCVLVAVCPELSVIEKRWNQSREMFTLEQVTKVRDIYVNMFYGENEWDAHPDLRINSSNTLQFVDSIYAIYCERVLKA